MTAECYRCGDPIEGHPVELERHPDGERIEIHGSCLLKSYSGKAYEEDKPKIWKQPHKAHYDYSLTEHVDAIIDDENEPSETYERCRELMEASHERQRR